MTDELLQELWDTKDNIAKEHGYNMDALAEYFRNQQATRHERFHVDKRDKKAAHASPADAPKARATEA